MEEFLGKGEISYVIDITDRAAQQFGAVESKVGEIHFRDVEAVRSKQRYRDRTGLARRHLSPALLFAIEPVHRATKTPATIPCEITNGESPTVTS